MRRVIEIVSCDQCGAQLTEGHGRTDVRFTWQGRDYVVDLCDRHYEAATMVMRGLIESARLHRERELDVRRTRRLPADAPRDEVAYRKQVRAWGIQNGYRVSERGAIPRYVVDAYENRHSLSVS